MENLKGIGKIIFIPKTENTYSLKPHHFLINQTPEGFEVIDIECGLVTFDFKDVFTAIKNLGDMIIDHAISNIKKIGIENYEKLYNLDDSLITEYNFRKELFDRIKQTTPDTTKEVKTKDFTSTVKYSLRNVA